MGPGRETGSCPKRSRPRGFGECLAGFNTGEIRQIEQKALAKPIVKPDSAGNYSLPSSLAKASRAWAMSAPFQPAASIFPTRDLSASLAA